MSVRPVAGGRDVLHDHVDVDLARRRAPRRSAAASPTLSGTPTTVILASLRSWATPAMIACSMALLPPGASGQDPGAVLRARRRTGRGPGCRSGGRTRRSAGAGSWRRRPPSRASPRRRSRSSLRAVGTMPRVGGEDAVDVGVDLADLGAERRGQGDGRGVGGAAAERGDVLGVLRDALEAGDDRDGALRRARASIRPGVMSMILALPCARVGDDAGLGAGERPGRVAEVGDRHREQRHRDPLAGGQQHVELARRRQRD